ncbi:WD40-repeat-containing domain protein [Boletus edulis BED1]|uniref:WD40-repeat-containing domain protein n=1 Tax=Boletus edulis BED1 TaxID=1328754 RepID=A0AAD4BIE8_BOLED|nr:WD40-repeat-containing domain protein [Boletus edulis BED1]
MLEIKARNAIYTILFAEDGKQVLSGGVEGKLRRWRVEDGQEVDKPIRTKSAEIFAAALSPDGKWLVCGLRPSRYAGAAPYVMVWDALTHEKVFDIHSHTNTVLSVDVSPDSAKFATGSVDNLVFIWSMRTGQRRVGPLFHDGWVVAVRFSPDGDRIATASASFTPNPKSIRIYNSKDGQQLLNIPFWFSTEASSPLAWSIDGRQLFAVWSGGSEAKSFDTSSGMLLSKWSLPSCGSSASVAPACNQKFIIITSSKSMSFWDTLTCTQIGTVIKHANDVLSIALSPSDDCIVTGDKKGKVTIRSLHDILPSSYLTANDGVIHSWLETAIDDIIHGVFKISPLVLIDVKSGRLCSGAERAYMFKSEPHFKALVSSMTKERDDRRIQQVVEDFFRYVMLSHVWRGKEPSFQDVEQAGSVWKLDSSTLNEKLHKFCRVVHSDGYRWAWSDTCCIDKTISTVLNQSLKMMYKWYEASTATFVHLEDVASALPVGGLRGSKWLTRAWTSQELLAPKVVRFYTRDWKPYLGDTRTNHKESPVIMQELADAIQIARETIISFKPDDLTTREKLRLASTRKATLEEDIAYSLIGIFKSDIRPDYGEGDAALGHLLEEIVARSGDVRVLDWTGKSSSYNSCLPTIISVYNQLPYSSPAANDVEMDNRVAALKCSPTDAALIHKRVTRLPFARFANRRLHLPCIIFTVRKLDVQDIGSGLENCYRAKVAGIGEVGFQTSDRLSLEEPRGLIFVHPWIRDLRDPLDGFTWRSTVDDDMRPAATMNEYNRALWLVVRLQQPFHALLLQQQPDGEFKRIAAEHEIIVPGIQLERPDSLARDIHTGVVDIL